MSKRTHYIMTECDLAEIKKAAESAPVLTATMIADGVRPTQHPGEGYSVYLLGTIPLEGRVLVVERVSREEPQVTELLECEICGSDEVVRLKKPISQVGGIIPIIGCGNPFHYV